MTDPGFTAPNSERVEREAHSWVVRLTSGRATAADADALRRWCAETPLHARAFERAKRLWRSIGVVAQGLPVPATAPPAGPARLGRRALLGGALAASAVGAVYGLRRPPLGLWPSLAELASDYRTGVGERRRVPVGTASIELNTRTSVLVQAAGETDRIELVAGEAVIEAGDRAVEAVSGEGRVAARHASFVLRRDPREALVTCLAGEVQVAHGAEAATLRPREQVAYGPSGMGRAGPVDPAVVTSWRQGVLVFRRQPLARVLEEVNRYRPGRIVLLDEALGARTVEGSFRLDRLGDVVSMVREVYGARVRSLPGGLVLVG